MVLLVSNQLHTVYTLVERLFLTSVLTKIKSRFKYYNYIWKRESFQGTAWQTQVEEESLQIMEGGAGHLVGI